MTGKGQKLKKVALISSILLVTAAIVTLVSAQILVSWWELIHCSGVSGVNHDPGTKPNKETYSTAGNSVSQCHGTAGEQGTCSDSDMGASWSVGCWTTLSGDNKCRAQVTCSDGTSLSCSGVGQAAFAGTYGDSVSATVYAFVECQSPSGSVLSYDRCSISE